MQYVTVAQLLILLSLANGSPVIVKGILGDAYATPIDGNIRFVDGRALLGPSKTIRGIVSSLLVTALGAPLIGLQFEIGLLVAAAAMAGDLLSSFLKRRFDLAPSTKATGLDQIPEALFPLRACRSALSLTAIDIATGCIIFFIGAVLFSRLFSGWVCATALIELPQHRRCNVISGRQLKRTVTIEDPTPTEV
jgi:hypothetical protein